jgi:hypothetical protein
MTTRITVVNDGPGNVEVTAGGRSTTVLKPNDKVSEYYVYPGQEIVVKEQYPKKD